MKVLSLLLAALLLMTAFAGCRSAEGGSSGVLSDLPSVTTAATTTPTTVVTTAPTTVPTTVAADPAVKAHALLTDSHLADIYRTSYKSVFDRVQENGFFQESVTGRYRGEYVRSIGALACLSVEVNELPAAGRALRFVTNVMKNKNLSYLPFTISADGQTVRTEDELDGRAHFVLGWALYIQKAGDRTYFEESYDLMKREADAFCSSTYFYEQFGLVRNRRFTHTRMRNSNDYHDVFDLLTNTFTASALEQMIAVATAYGKPEDAVLWQNTLDKMKTGIAKNLTRQVNGKTVYLEQRYYDNGQGNAENGVSWVCLSPVATGFSGVDPQILQNTAAYTRSVLWKDASKGGYLAVESSAGGSIKNWILGKSVGWDLGIAGKAGDWEHICDTLEFLNTYHTQSLYMERMQPSGNSWKLIDCGNGEQVIWFLWGMARVRQAAGLSAKP